MISRFSDPDPDLRTKSSGALYVCDYLGHDGYMVVDAKSIQSVVAMVALPSGPLNDGFSTEHVAEDNREAEGITHPQLNKRYFLVEKVGLEILGSAEAEETLANEIS
jgi:hypothetical protein